MKISKTRKKFCPFCKKHTEHKVAISKKRTANNTHTQSHGSKVRQHRKHKGIDIGFGNKGRFSRPAVNKRKMSGKKQSKKTDFRFTCNVCNKTSVGIKSVRVKKMEFI